MVEATRRGFAVVPLGGRDGKVPRLDGWPQRGLATIDELYTWQRSWPGTNYGILTGEASEVDVLDFDVAGSGYALMAAWARLQERIGAIPETWSVATGGGLHVYVRHVPGAGSHPRIFGLPIDYLSTGRQAVGPGSVHRSGTIYRELDPAVAVAALPDPGRLIAALQPTVLQDGFAEPPATTPEPPRRRLVARRGVTGKQALERVVAAVDAAGEGARNDTLNREVYFLGPYMAYGALERPDVEEACRQAAIRAGLALREVQATLASACGDGIRDSAPDPAEDRPADRTCTSPPLAPPRSLTRVRRRYHPLTAWTPGELTPALAAIWRSLEASTWSWRGGGLDRALFEHLLGLAQARGLSLEVEASLRYLSGELGAHTKYIADSLRRLQAHGWLALARQGGPTGRASVRAPSAYRLQVPAALAVPAPRYPRAPRAHQLKKLSMGGSSHDTDPVFEHFRPADLPSAGDAGAAADGGGAQTRGECLVSEVVGGAEAVQERLGGDDLEIWASPTAVPVAAGEEALRSRRGRGRAGRLRTAQKKSAATVGHHMPHPLYPAAGGRRRGDIDEDLARALEALRAAGLEAVVCSG
jgi:hypothetical protein